MSFARPLFDRALALIVLGVAGAAVVFFLMRAAPGDPALTVLGDNATPEAIAAFRQRWNLDRPVLVQFWLWLAQAVRGDLGVSLTISNGTSIYDLLAARLPQTAFIGAYAILIAIVVSMFAGTIAALQRGRAGDTVASSFAAMGISMPDFWIAYILIYVFALGTGWFPSYGYTAPTKSFSGALHSGFLP